MKVLPKTVKKIAVLDRTKEPGAMGEPLYLDVVNLFYRESSQPVIVGGRYGLGSNDVRPSQILAVFRNLKREEPKNRFTIGIVDDVTDTSLEKRKTSHDPNWHHQLQILGLGSDGTVGANKSP